MKQSSKGHKKQGSVIKCLYQPLKCNYEKQKTYKKYASYVLGFLSIISSMYFFMPKLSIDIKEPLNPKEVLSAPIIIRNESEFSIHNVNFSYVFNSMRDTTGHEYVKNIGAFKKKIDIGNLLPGEKSHNFIFSPFKFNLSTEFKLVDIVILVKYRPSFFPYSRTKYIRFQAIQDINKNYVWLPKSLSE